METGSEPEPGTGPPPESEEGRLAIIGGTGFHLREAGNALGEQREETVTTRWGAARVTLGTLHGHQLVFLDRHRAGAPSRETRLPPHRINYRANIAALKKLGVTGVLASTAVGSLRPEWPPGTLVLLDQLMDQTRTRRYTFFDDQAVHVDLTEPYCRHLRKQLRRAARSQQIQLEDGGTYICTEGPRFETPAEIRAFRVWGADVVGMTAVPEAVLAREAQLSYSGVSVVTNPAAGLGREHLTEAEVLDAMDQAMPQVAQLFLSVAADYHDDPDAPARRATAEFGDPEII